LRLRMADGEGNLLRADFEPSENGDSPVELELVILGNRFSWTEGGLLRWTQNGRVIPLDEFMRKQLIRYVSNVGAMSPSKRNLLEAVLRRSPSEGASGQSEPAPELDV